MTGSQTWGSELTRRRLAERAADDKPCEGGKCAWAQREPLFVPLELALGAEASSRSEFVEDVAKSL